MKNTILACLAALPAVVLVSCGKPQPVTSPRIWPPARPGYANPIPAENALPGDANWADGVDAAGHQLEAYGDRISAKRGDTFGIHVAADASTTASWVLYRLGWYGGAAARAVASGGPVGIGPQAPCPMEPVTGLIRCDWPATFLIQIAATDVSGLYALKLVRHDGRVRFVPLVVVDDRSADLLFQASVQTYEAYNAWGGTSLYTDASRTLPLGHATKVSFDRPFDSGRGLGQMLSWEAPMARFLERYGYDVSYATNVDLGTAGGPFVERAGMFLSVGHDEYWAGEERDAVERARDHGVPLGFFSANTGYWKVRYEDLHDERNPRTVVCYKTGDDPLGAGASGLFRGNTIRRPENALEGVMYDSWQFVPFSFVVGDPTSWLYAGTGLKSGDVIPGIVGYEFDHSFANGFGPAHLTILSRSPVVDNRGKPGWAETTTYRAGSGAFVFASGSIYWSRGLDPLAVMDERVERMTANVFHEALQLPIPEIPKESSPPRAPSSSKGGPIATAVSTVASGLPSPAGLAEYPGGQGKPARLVVALPDTARIAAIDTASGATEILAGGGEGSPHNPDDAAPGASVRFGVPVAVAVDLVGRVYVADSGEHIVRRIDPDAAHTTIVLAGASGQSGNADDIGPNARFSRPNAIALDPTASTLYVADTGNHRIRAVNLTTRTVTTIAGSSAGDADGPGVTARFVSPTGLAVAPDGRIFVLSTAAQKVKVILPDSLHTVVTLAGIGGDGVIDGPGTAARLSPQSGIAWTGTFLAISDGPSLRVRALVPGTSAATTQVYTLAFSGRFGSSDGLAEASEIGLPTGLAADADGTIYVADAANGTIRVIHPLP